MSKACQHPYTRVDRGGHCIDCDTYLTINLRPMMESEKEAVVAQLENDNLRRRIMSLKWLISEMLLQPLHEDMYLYTVTKSGELKQVWPRA